MATKTEATEERTDMHVDCATCGRTESGAASKATFADLAVALEERCIVEQGPCTVSAGTDARVDFHGDRVGGNERELAFREDLTEAEAEANLKADEEAREKAAADQLAAAQAAEKARLAAEKDAEEQRLEQEKQAEEDAEQARKDAVAAQEEADREAEQARQQADEEQAALRLQAGEAQELVDKMAARAALLEQEPQAEAKQAQKDVKEGPEPEPEGGEEAADADDDEDPDLGPEGAEADEGEDDLVDAMTKQELLEYAQAIGASPANNAMTKAELRASVDEKLAEEEQDEEDEG